MKELVEGKSLDSLCDYFEIDRSKRITHGALVDTELLADFFITMPDFVLSDRHFWISQAVTLLILVE